MITSELLRSASGALWAKASTAYEHELAATLDREADTLALIECQDPDTDLDTPAPSA